MRIRAAAVATVVALASAPGPVRAQPGEGGNAAAESLFQDARRMMDARHYGEACPKFLASHKLSPAIGTLLNLADCYEKNGQVASAWARFHEAIALAQRLGRPEREKTAKERADKLEPRLLKITINAHTPNVEVKIDGNALDSAVLGTPIPVDAGKHTVEASAKGKKPFTTTIEVHERMRAPIVDVPLLDDEAGAPPPPPMPPPVERPVTPPKGDDANDGAAMRILGIVGMGVGVVGIGVGSVFGLRTSSLWSDAQARCTNNECDATGVDLASDAKTSGNVSTIAFIAGGSLAAIGLVLFITAPSAPVKVGIGPGSVGVGGRF